MTDYLRLMRPNQWVKNLFIFSPIFFGQKMFDIGLLIKASIAFLVFSLVASSIYIFNDYFDIEYDRRHPIKRSRPLASGRIAIRSALVFMAVLLITGLSAAYALIEPVFYLMLIYVLLNLAYTIRLKHIAIVDIFIIAIGFVLRIFVGGVASGVQLSMWIVIMTFLLALFLALAKRRDDVLIFLDDGQKMRKVIDGYNIEFLNSCMVIMASVIIVSYIMYSRSEEVLLRMHAKNLYLSVLFVILGIMRYLQIAFVFKDSGSPTKVIYTDKFMQLTILGWILTFFVIMYAQT